MKSNVEQLNPVQYRLNIEVEPAEVTKAFDGAYRDLQRKASIQGFRPGKAPLSIIRKLYGDAVSRDVLDKLINVHLYAAINAQTLRPIASPMVNAEAAPIDGQAFNFNAVVDVLPEIKIDGYQGLAVSAKTLTVNEPMVERELRRLRLKHARTRAVEPGAVAAAGMVATIDHRASHAGQDVPRYAVEGMQVKLGEEELFPALEAGILGLKVGEEKDVTITLPADSDDREHAGKDLVFHVVLKDLQLLDLPALDDEFAKDMNFETAADLTEKVRTFMEERAKEESRKNLEDAIMDQLLGANPFEVPPAMVDQVIDSLIQEMHHQSADDRKKALRDDKLRQALLPTAKRRTQNTLILWHVSQQEKLEVSASDVDARVTETLNGAGIKNGDKGASDIRRSLEARVRETMVFEKAMDFLIASAKVTNVPV